MDGKIFFTLYIRFASVSAVGPGLQRKEEGKVRYVERLYTVSSTEIERT